MDTLIYSMMIGHLDNIRRSIDIDKSITRDDLKEIIIDLVFLISECDDETLHQGYRKFINEKFDENRG